MDACVVSAFLEELVYESDEGVFAHVLFDLVAARGLECDTFVRASVWPLIVSHRDVLFVSPESSWEQLTHLDVASIPQTWPEPSPANGYESDVSLFNTFKLLASPALRCSVLDVWDRPELCNNPIQLRLLSAIASARYKGLWQIELSNRFKIDSKSLFQHLKTLYKYDLVVRYQLPITGASRKSRNVSASGILWLKRFFNTQKIPSDVLTLLYSQQRDPIKRKLLDLLTTLPQQTALETDIRAFCISLLLGHGHSRLVPNFRTAARQYAKLRRDLLTARDLRAVKAWCPETNDFRDCLALYGTAQRFITQSRVDNAEHLVTALPQDPKLSAVVVKKEPNLVLSPSVSPDLWFPDAGSGIDHTPLDPELGGADHVNVSVKSVNLSALSALSKDAESKRTSTEPGAVAALPCQPIERSAGAPPLDDGELDANVQAREGLQQHEDEEDQGCYSYTVYELPIAQQVLCLIYGMADKGVLSTEISAVMGITTKRLTRLLQTLEAATLIKRRGQRLEKHFVYRFFPGTTCSHLRERGSGEGAPLHSSETERLVNTTAAMPSDALPKESAAPFLSTFVEAQPLAPKMQTDQFKMRLQWVVAWIEQHKACILPQLSRMIQEKEKSRSGPERKTIIRLLNYAMQAETRLQKTLLTKGRSEPVSVYYWSPAITPENAQKIVERAIAERRSEGCKDTMRKHLGLVRHLNRTAELLPDSVLSTKHNEPDATAPVVASDNVVPGTLSDSETNVVAALQQPDVTLNDQKSAAILKLVESMKKVPMSDASTFSSRHAARPLLPHLHVNVNQLLRRKPIGLRFSQAVLGHYGFVFPLMIRLKLFHSHLLDIAYPERCGADPTTFSAAKSDTRSPETTLIPQVTLTTLSILQKMPIETFFRTIGCGYRHPYLDDILRNTVSVTPLHRVEELPPSVYQLLLCSSYRGWRPTRHLLHSTASSAVLAADRLLQKLVTMKCIGLKRQPSQPSSINSSQQDLAEATALAALSPSSDDSILWEPFSEVKLERFVGSTPDASHVLAPRASSSDAHFAQRFKVVDPIAFDAYWRTLKSQVDRWLYSNAATAENSKCSSFLVVKPEDHQNDANGITPLSSSTSALRSSRMDALFHSATRQAPTAQKVFSPLKKKTSAENVDNTWDQRTPDGEEDDDDKLNAHLLRTVRLPDNMPLAAAFNKRNWKGQMLLSWRVRMELEHFASSLVMCATTAKGETSAPQQLVLRAAFDIDAEQHLYNHCSNSRAPINNDASGDTLDLQPLSNTLLTAPLGPVVNPQTPEIRHLAEKLKIPTDVVIRYLLRFFHSAEHNVSRVSPGGDTGAMHPSLQIHTGSREPRYRCHICGTTYFQRPSVAQHYHVVHRQALPGNPALYVLSWNASCRNKDSNIPPKFPAEKILPWARNRRSTRQCFSSPLDSFQDERGSSTFPALFEEPLAAQGDIYSIAEEFCEGVTVATSDDASGATPSKNVTPNCCTSRNGNLFSSSADKRDNTIVRNILARLRRDDHFLLLGLAAVAERLLRSAKASCHFSSSLSASSLETSTLVKPVNNESEDVFVDFHNGRLPSGTHPVWQTMAALQPLDSVFHGSPERCRLALTLLLNNVHTTLHLRVFRGFRRASASSLMHYLHRGDIPPATLSNAGAQCAHPRHLLSSYLLRQVPQQRQAQLVLWRNAIKIILLCPLVVYRPFWAFEAARHLQEAEIRAVFNGWYTLGWIVKVKSTFDRWSPVQRLMESRCRRKYYISHSAQQGLFWKAREYLFAQQRLSSLCTLPSVPSLSFANCTKESSRRLETGYCGEQLNRISEPISPPRFAGLLESFVYQNVRLELSWPDDPDFYHREDRGADDALLQLLLMTADSPAPSPDAVVTTEDDKETSPVQDDAALDLMMLMLDGEQQPTERLDTVENTGDLCLSDDADSLFFDSALHQKTSLEYSSFGQLVESSTHQRVLARAIDGGLEKHIHELTAHIPEIHQSSVVMYTQQEKNKLHFCNSLASFFSVAKDANDIDSEPDAQSSFAHEQPRRTLIDNTLFSFDLPKHTTSSSSPAFLRLCLPSFELLAQYGCTQDSDPVDPLLFSNITLARWLLSSDTSKTHQNKVLWQSENPALNPFTPLCSTQDIVPVYDADKSQGWFWAVNQKDTAEELTLNTPLSTAEHDPFVNFFKNTFLTYFSALDLEQEPEHKKSTVSESRMASSDTSSYSEFSFLKHFLSAWNTFCNKNATSISTFAIVVEWIQKALFSASHFDAQRSKAEAFWFLAGLLSDLLLKREFCWADFVTARSTPQTSEIAFHDQTRKTLAMDALLQMLQVLDKADVVGIDEELLHSSFQEHWDKLLISLVDAEKVSCDSRSEHQARPHDNDARNSSLFYRSVFVLEALRCIVRIPAGDQWRLVSSHHASSNYCILRRLIVDYQIIETQEKDHNLTAFAVHPLIRSQLLTDGGLGCCKDIIPKRIWALWGPPAQLQWEMLVSSSKQNELSQVLSNLHESDFILLVLRLTLTISLQNALLEAYQNDALKLRPLHPSLIPYCGWIQLDGHLNVSLIAFLVNHVWLLLGDAPGALRSKILQRTPIFDESEITFLLDTLCEENVVVSLQPFIGDSVGPMDLQYFRQLTHNIRSC